MILEFLNRVVHGLIQYKLILTPMGIVTIGAIHAIQILVHFILQNSFRAGDNKSISCCPVNLSKCSFSEL